MDDDSAGWVGHLNEEPVSAVGRYFEGHRGDPEHFGQTLLKREDALELVALIDARPCFVRWLRGRRGPFGPGFGLFCEGVDCRTEDIGHLQAALKDIAQLSQRGMGNRIVCHEGVHLLKEAAAAHERGTNVRWKELRGARAKFT